MINDFELEKLEERQLNNIVDSLRQDIKRLTDGLNSRIKILNDWKNEFLRTARKGYNSSDLDTGAERIFHNLFATTFRFPNTCPIGSDMVYEIERQAIIHIEVKTALVTNPADYKGKVQLNWNQVSYKTKKFKPNLPIFYKSINVPTLTYVIQIVHEHMKPKINALNVICIPNGRLLQYYGDSILNAGKAGWAKAKDIRYNYAKEPYFSLLKQRYKEDRFRIEILLLDKKLTIKDVTGKNLPLSPYKRI